MDMPTPPGQAAHQADRRPRPSRFKVAFRFIVVAIVLGAVVGGLYEFQQIRAAGMAKFFAGNVPPPIPVSVIEAQAEAMPRYLEGIGTLVAVHQVTVSPEVSGRVVKVLFEPGTAVKKGEPLVQIDDGPERGDLAMYQAQARLAEVNLKRAEALANKEFGTQANVDLNKSQLDQASAGIAKTQAIIAQKQVYAPFDGKLGVRQIDLGQYLQAGTPIVTLTDLDLLYANFTLPEQDRSKVDVGQAVEIRVDAYPSQVFAGKVTTIEPQVDPQTRNIKVQATLANSDHLLLPGMYANAEVVLTPEPGVVTVPETAVYNTAYGDSVYVIKEDTADGKPVLKAMQTFVKTGTRHDGKVAILSGLSAGDKLAKEGQIRLHNDAAVTIATEPDALKKPETPPRD
jgi:multidrug efflux system membrane fusion protein